MSKVVAQWLAHLPLVLEVLGSIPACDEENFGVLTCSLVSCAGMTLDKCAVLRIGDVNWMSHVPGKSPLVQVKEPYGNLDMVTCRLSPCDLECTKYTRPADNARKCVRQYIEKERKL